MNAADDARFAGSVPQVYERCLVPLIFDGYAQDLAARVAARSPARVLELAAGTGALTRRLAADLPATARIVATDLNAPMLEQAQRGDAARAVTWQQADALDLPFQAEAFDLVVCQFGLMFFADRPAALRQALRVLRPGGALLLNVWGEIGHNGFAAAVSDALQAAFAEDPPRFLPRVPYGCHDVPGLLGELYEAGFTQPEAVTVDLRSHADSPQVPAVAFCQGTPLRHEIEARAGMSLAQATEHTARELARRYGDGPIEAPMRAHVFSAVRPRA